MENSIREVQVHISDALEQWSYIMNKFDADGTAFLLHYSENDLLNIVYMFDHIVSNIGIHKGVVTEENAEQMGKDIREFVKKYTGVDTRRAYAKSSKEWLKFVKTL